MKEYLSFEILFVMNLNMNIKTKDNENNKKKKNTKYKFRKFEGYVIKIKIINFPSFPPIIFKLYNRNEGIKANKKKKIWLQKLSKHYLGLKYTPIQLI